jgi:hypothetical protein
VTSTTVPPTSVTTAPGQTTTTPPTTQPESSEVTIYLLNESGQAIPTTRTVTTEGVARAALQALIDGPTPQERAAGLSTAFPADSLIFGIAIDGGTATVDMSREFEAGGGSFAILGRLAQLVYTLTEFDSVDRVDLLLDGEEIEYFSGEGVIVGDGWTRSDFSGSNPIGDPLDSSGPATWEQGDLPQVDPESDQARTVVLVAADDYLNVREPAGASETIIGRLLPGALVNATGSRTEVSGSTWTEIETPTGTGWVNGLFLAPTMDGLPTRIGSRGPGRRVRRPPGPGRGLHRSRFRKGPVGGPSRRSDPVPHRGSDGDPRRFHHLSLGFARPRTRQPRDRAPHVRRGDRRATGRRLRRPRPRGGRRWQFIEGPNGRPAEFALPVQFQGFPFVTLFDPGDDPQYEGLDWMSWVVSMSYEDGGLRVVGLTVDQWAP